jgi:hypothetical protein
VDLKDKFVALAVVKSWMDDIKQGTFIGTATVAQPDGSLRAVEVVVFPESLRGFGEGHYPWDLGPSSMMTNATIANKVQSTDGQTVPVSYKGGEKENHHTRQRANRCVGPRRQERHYAGRDCLCSYRKASRRHVAQRGRPFWQCPRCRTSRSCRLSPLFARLFHASS